MSTEEQAQRLSSLLRRLLTLKVSLAEAFRFGERQVTLVWAAVIDILGALVTKRFRRATSACSTNRQSTRSKDPSPRWSRTAGETLIPAPRLTFGFITYSHRSSSFYTSSR